VKRQLVFIVVAALNVFVACESKFVESSPSAVDQDGSSVQERMKNKTSLDSRINEIDQTASKIKNIVDLFRKIKNPKAGEDNYTPIDFMLELNGKLKEKMPSKCEAPSDETCFFRKSSFEMPIKELSENCRKVDALLESKSMESTETAETIWAAEEFWGPQIETKTVKTDKFTYSLKTCNTDEKYMDVMEVFITEGRVKLEVNNKNLEKLFTQMILSDELKTTNCKVPNEPEPTPNWFLTVI
jgi:hypothetical protein